MRSKLRSLLAAWIVVACAVDAAAAREEKIVNPKPDQMWGRSVGGLFTSGKSIAVVIAISRYIGEQSGGYPALGTAVNDADKMVQFLLEDAGFDTVYVLTDEHATKPKIEHLMTDEVPNVVGKYDRFLFYWSGHGDQMLTGDQRVVGFLPLAESKRKVFSTMLNMDDIARWNGYLAAQQALFVLDACLSGLAGSEAKGVRDVRLEQLSQPARQLVTAGTEKENVISGDRWTGSLFTDSFIKGAKGAAQHSFGIVSLHTLIDYIQENVALEKERANWSNSLTPQVRKLSAGNGAFFFTPKEFQSSIKLPDLQTAGPTPEAKGEEEPVVVAATAPATIGSAAALLERLGAANVSFSVEEAAMLSWLDLPDEKYRRIAQASLSLLGERRLKRSANLDVVVYKYVVELGLEDESGLPPQPAIDAAALEKALVAAYNEQNGAAGKSLADIVEPAAR